MSLPNTPNTALAAQNVRLKHVNAAPAQTWNWLRINETEVDVSMDAETAASFAEPQTIAPLAGTGAGHDVRSICLGCGTQATAWIDTCAQQRFEYHIAATQDTPVIVDLSQPQTSLAQVSVVVEEDAHATIVILAHNTTDDSEKPHTATSEEMAFESTPSDVAQLAPANPSASNLRVLLQPQSHCNIYVLVAQNTSSRHISNMGLVLQERAQAQLHHYVLGSTGAYVGMQAELAGEEAQLESSIRYIAQTDELRDFNWNVIHLAPRTHSSIEATGVLTHNAKKTLRATIDLVRGCKGAEGAEQETVVVEGEDIVNKTLPTILCSEDDVAGNHGATIGSLSDEQLFYLACRGIDPQGASQLLRDAIIDDARAHFGTAGEHIIDAWKQQQEAPGKRS